MALKRILLAVTGVILFACISRNNPWDPVNYTDIFKGTIYDSATASIDSGFKKLPLYLIDTIQAKLSAIKAADSMIEVDDSIIYARNSDTLVFNAAADSINKTLSTPLLDFTRKRFLGSVYIFIVPSDTLSSQLQSLKTLVSIEKQRVDSIISNSNVRARPVVIFTPAHRDSVQRRYDSIVQIIDTLDGRVSSFITYALTTNDDPIKPYNIMVKDTNDAVKRYNDSMAKFLGPKVIPNNQDSLVIYLRNAVAGNKFILFNGTMELDSTIRFLNSGTLEKPIIIEGQDSTKINKSDVVLDANSYIIFNKIKFTGSSAQCVLIQNGCTGIVFNQCQFEANTNRGLTISSSDVTLNECIVKDGAQGISISSQPEQARTVSLDNVVIMNSGGNGITVSGSHLFIRYATIIRNGGEAIYLAPPALNLGVLNTIIANNGGKDPTPAIYFEGGYTGAYQFIMSNVNMVQNGENQDTVNAPVTEPILHYDPMFINEFDISPSSYLDTLDKAGTVIGYRKK